MPRSIFAAILFTAACRPEPTLNPTPEPEPTTTPTPDDSGGGEGGGPAPAQGETCGDAGLCGEGLTCVEYFGIAGPSGPKFTSCEIPCPDETSTCPEGQQCITIADGPGRVCRTPQP